MATSARQSKGPPMKKTQQQDSNPVSQSSARRPAWGNNRGTPSPVPSFASAAANPRVANGFPPLGHTNGSKAGNAVSNEEKERLLTGLAGHIGSVIVVTLRSSVRYEGTLTTVTPSGQDDGSIVLKDVKDAETPGAPIKDSLIIQASSLASFQPAPTANRIGDSFRTDTEISRTAQPKRERELQAWHADAPGLEANVNLAGPNAAPNRGDDVTFGPNAGAGRNWDQFAANERLFGVRTQFDEDVYTTKLDRSGKDYKEREKRAERLAAEITGSVTTNPHVAEERNVVVDDSEMNEEDKYGAVVRGPEAYVPPSRRLSPNNGTVNPTGNARDKDVNKVKLEVPKVSVNGPDGSEKTLPGKATSPPVGGAASKAPADALPAFRDFVTSEKQRLTQKRQALVKSEMDKRMADLVKFSQSFKLNKPIPEDLVSILAKDEEKQKQIREKSTRDAASVQARAIGVSSSILNTGPTTSSKPPATGATGVPVPSTARPADLGRKPAASAQKPTAAVPVSKSSNAISNHASSTTASQAATNGSVKLGSSTTMPKINMVIQVIPPFRGRKQAGGSKPPAVVASPLSPTSAQRLNVNATSFKPNPKAVAFTPITPINGPSSSGPASAVASPKVKPSENMPPAPNLFFGTLLPKKTPPVNVKDDFNPFRHNKVAEASAVSAIWPYNGKRYMMMFPAPPAPPPQTSPHMTPHAHPPPHQPTYEEDPAAQAAARGYAVYAYAPYGYPGQPPHQPMMGMPGVPPGFVPAPYMQHIPYPPNMPPPPGQPMYAPPPMGQMPPPQYMPPPGIYPPPPNGSGPRPSMPPTPIPSHTHPYYHQSPHLQHAVPYMMMPPPGQGGPPHHYEGGPPQSVQMGNVGHA